MITHFITLISEKMTKVYRVIVRRKVKNHCRTRIKVHHAEESGRTMDGIQPCDVKDEFTAPELHLGHQKHQLIPGNSSFTYHKAPSSFQREKTGCIKNLPTEEVLKHLPTRPEPTQTKGLDEATIREMKEKLNLRKDLEKTKNLDNIIRTIYHIKRIEDSPYKEAMNASFTTPA